jgi:lysophospholipase L1-like esterase
MINSLKENNISILVLGLSPVTDNFPVTEGADFQKKQKDIYIVYNDSIKKIAAENMLDFLNIREIYSSKGDLGEYIQADGIHPAKAGLKLISESVFNYIVDSNILN